MPRPIRPAHNWKDNNFLGDDPASATIKHRPVDLAEHAVLVEKLEHIPPEDR